MRQSNCIQISIVAVVVTLAIIATLSAISAMAGASHTNPLSGLGKKLSTLTLSKSHNSDLILYSYYETEEAQENLQFFLSHALHAQADFIFLINGNYTVQMPARSNIRVIERENKCLDLGAYHEVLSANRTLTRYKRFIMLNASIRGPFFPSWADDMCWSDAFFDKLTPHIKAVGLTYDCARDHSSFMSLHLQSTLLATDRQAMLDVLLPNLHCYGNEEAVLAGETQMTNWLRQAGYMCTP